MSTIEVVMIRHAQSTWNADGKFTGWSDPPLTALGVAEAEKAGRALRQRGYQFDRVFTSRLQRADATARIILGCLSLSTRLVEADWRLNERHYGDLQGRSKQQLIDEVGEDQVHRWRRGYHDSAPALSDDDPRHPRFDKKYADLRPDQLPAVESLADTRVRAMEFWQEDVMPAIRGGERVLIAAHGNTLRAMIMALDGMSELAVEEFEIPTGTPIIYRFNEQGMAKGWEYLQTRAA